MKRYLVVFAVLVSLTVQAQDLPPQPDLDLPVRVENYLPGAPAAPINPPPEDDPRDEALPTFFGEEIDSENSTIIYVIDCSGSMGRGERMETAQLELTKSIKGLAPAIRFNVISFSCILNKWNPALQPATEANKAAACQWVNALHSSGGTGTAPGVVLGLSYKEVMSVVLLTDGAPNCGAQGAIGHRNMIRGANTQGATINVFGIDARGTWREFCIDVASDSGGSYFDVADSP